MAAFSVSWSFYTVGRTPWTEDQPVARPLPVHRTAQAQNKRTITSMPLVGFEPTIPVLERAKTVCALDGATTAIGRNYTSESCFCLQITQRYSEWLRAGRPRVRSFESRWRQDFSLHVVQTGSGATQPAIQWVPGTLSPGVERPWLDADHSPPARAEVKTYIGLQLWFKRRNGLNKRRTLNTCYEYNRPWRPIRLSDVEDPTFSRQWAHRWRWGCQPYAPAALYPRKIPGTNFC
jgi:hypothetical protein